MNAILLKDLSKHFIINDRRPLPLYREILNRFSAKRDHHVLKALQGINLDIKAGEKVGVIGLNGAGKTTLLRIIAGIYQPTSGECLTSGKVAAFLQSGLGIAPLLSVLDNIKLYGAIIGLTERQVESSVKAILEFAELFSFRFAPLQQLSPGMQQRLFFSILSQTLHFRSASIFLFDESLNAGDKKFSEKCKSFLGHLRNTPKTIIFSSHSPDQIQVFCSKCVYLERGTVRCFGDTETVLKEYLASC